MITKRIAVLQSNYIPWRGYFDILGSVDEFVLYDVVQYTKNDWRNRNRIRTSQGTQWLTIPVETAGRFGQTIAEAGIARSNWADKHWRAISQAYARAPHFAAFGDRIQRAYAACAGDASLSSVNRAFITLLAELLGLTTRITDAPASSAVGDRSERLVAVCRDRGATHYLSGPSAAAYLDLRQFKTAGIVVEFMDYSQYQPYPQVHGGAFVPDVSCLDLLFNLGPEARRHLPRTAGPPGGGTNP